jgi:predicted O-methyltransferase YrrM
VLEDWTLAKRASSRFRDVLRGTFPLWERLGLHVTPVHYYQPVPDTRALPEALWRDESALPGIDLAGDAQLDLLDALRSGHRAEYESLARAPTGVDHRYHLGNGFFDAVDAEVLYALLRHLKPRRYVEVGSGYSTLLAAQALLRNREDGAPCELVVVDPNPSAVVRAGFAGLTELVPRPVQELPPDVVERLQPGDVLFVDSTHVLAVGSDVQHLFQEVLPRLGPGVVVHLHDIFLPGEYPREWVHRMRWFWNEQYVLAAFLAFNTTFDVMWAASWLHRHHPGRLARAFSSYRPGASPGPSSFWMRRAGAPCP